MIVHNISSLYSMEDSRYQVPASLPRLPKLRLRPSHHLIQDNKTIRPINETSASPEVETASTVSKLLMKSELSRFKKLQAQRCMGRHQLIAPYCLAWRVNEAGASRAWYQHKYSLSWLPVAGEVGCSALISCSSADERKPSRVCWFFICIIIKLYISWLRF